MEVFLKNPPEMKPVYCKGDSLREEARTFECSPEEKSPVMEPFFPNDPENDHRPEKCSKVVETEMNHFFLRGNVFPQECPDPCIVVPG